MFQQAQNLLDTASLGRITDELSKKPRCCNGHSLAKGLNSKRLSNFSDVSEILDGRGSSDGALEKRKQCELERGDYSTARFWKRAVRISVRCHLEPTADCCRRKL